LRPLTPTAAFSNAGRAGASGCDARFLASAGWRRSRAAPCRDFVIIEQIAPGVRIRVGFAAASDLETDFGDEEIERLLEDEPSLRGELARIARIMGALL
jgi:hypothetical protein